MDVGRCVQPWITETNGGGAVRVSVTSGIGMWRPEVLPAATRFKPDPHGGVRINDKHLTPVHQREL